MQFASASIHKFLMDNIANINLSTWISLGALTISILGFLKARESLKHSKKISEENRLLEAEKERTELLYMISEEKELVENLISDLEGLKVIYDNENHITQTKLKNYANIFDTHLPKLKEGLRRVSSDYEAVISMDIATGPENFLKLRAYQKDTARDIRHAQKHIHGCIVEFFQKIIQVHEL